MGICFPSLPVLVLSVHLHCKCDATVAFFTTVVFYLRPLWFAIVCFVLVRLFLDFCVLFNIKIILFLPVPSLIGEGLHYIYTFGRVLGIQVTEVIPWLDREYIPCR